MATAAAPSPSSFLGAVVEGWVGEGGVEAPAGVEALRLRVGVTPVDEDGPTDHGLARRQEHTAVAKTDTAVRADRDRRGCDARVELTAGAELAVGGQDEDLPCRVQAQRPDDAGGLREDLAAAKVESRLPLGR